MKLCIQGLTRSILLLAFTTIAACGGGTEPIASLPTPFIMASVPAPAKKASTVTGGNGVVIHMYQALYGMAPSNALLIDYAFQANNDASTFAKNLTDRFASTSHADLAKLVLDNLGVTPTTVPAINAKGESEYVLLLDAVKQLFSTHPTMRGQVILNMTNLLTGLESDATYGAAAIAYNKQASDNFSNTATYSVPTDITKVVYPNSYQTQTTLVSDINTDPCKLDLDIVTYPKSWIGSFPLPQVNGAPLRNTISRGMGLRDTGYPNNPRSIDGCNSSNDKLMQGEYAKTIAKLKSMGVEYVMPQQWQGLSENPDGSWFVMRAEDSDSGLPDVDLEFFVKTAHAAGIKVIMNNQIQIMALQTATGHGPWFQPKLNLTNLRKWFPAYQAHLIDRAKFFQSIGVDVFSISCGSCIFGNLDDNTETDRLTMFYGINQSDGVAMKELVIQEYRKALANVKIYYSGKIMMTTSDWLHTIPDLVASVDIFSGGIGRDEQLTPETIATLTVESYRSKLSNSLQWRPYDVFGKVILLNLPGAGSRKEIPDQYFDDGYCIEKPGDFTAGDPKATCYQRTLSTDFSIQAIMLEGSLEYINSLNYNSPIIVFPGQYLLTDGLEFHTTFPNISWSIRNKPAEGLLKVWYAH